MQVYRETGVLPRGLTHPSAVPRPGEAKPRSRPRALGNAVSRALGVEAGSVGAEAPRRASGGRAAAEAAQGAGTVDGAFLARWGAVPVGPKELVGLLRAGETAMLFPGGATEVRSCSEACLPPLCVVTFPNCREDPSRRVVRWGAVLRTGPAVMSCFEWHGKVKEIWMY